MRDLILLDISIYILLVCSDSAVWMNAHSCHIPLKTSQSSEVLSALRYIYTQMCTSWYIYMNQIPCHCSPTHILILCGCFAYICPVWLLISLTLSCYWFWSTVFDLEYICIRINTMLFTVILWYISTVPTPWLWVYIYIYIYVQ